MNLSLGNILLNLLCPCFLRVLTGASQLWVFSAWILCAHNAHRLFLPLLLCLFILGLFGLLAAPGVYSLLLIQIETMTYNLSDTNQENRVHFSNLHRGNSSKGIGYTAKKSNKGW